MCVGLPNSVDNCKWLLQPDLTHRVLEAIENKQSVPTPLNIKDSVKASYNVLGVQQLEDLIKQTSQDTAGRFADEIIRMEEDEKAIFLTFPYIGRLNLNVNFVQRMHENIISAWAEKIKLTILVYCYSCLPIHSGQIFCPIYFCHLVFTVYFYLVIGLSLSEPQSTLSLPSPPLRK